MIANPTIPAFRYDPYSKKLTRERYDHREMRTAREDAVSTARKSIQNLEVNLATDTTAPGAAPLWGVILGTLGRQGNFRQLQVLLLSGISSHIRAHTLQALTKQLSQSSTSIPYMPILLSELSPAKLALFDPFISTFIQTSCPRLSIDWGYAFDKPLLSPYEATLAVDKEQCPRWMVKKDSLMDNESKDDAYPMNFYSMDSPWALARSKGYLVQPEAGG